MKKRLDERLNALREGAGHIIFVTIAIPKSGKFDIIEIEYRGVVNMGEEIEEPLEEDEMDEEDFEEDEFEEYDFKEEEEEVNPMSRFRVK